MLVKPVIEPSLILKAQELFPKVILASQSENRRKLLEDMNISVIQKPQCINELCGLTEPVEVVTTLSKQKLDSYLNSKDFDESLPAICLDTLVLFDGELIGKPDSEEVARELLYKFSSKKQEVLTGLSAYIPNKGCVTTYDSSEVIFSPLSAGEINWYISTGEWQGAAGGYRIQKNGYKLVEKIEGSWTNVIGFPLEKFISILTN